MLGYKNQLGWRKIDTGKFNSAIVQKERLLPGIHGLRGLAAVAVVLYHLIHIGGIKPPMLFNFIGRDFGYSVHLFFILSAFSLMYSTASKVNQPHWLSDYFIKRFFRIAPLFYLMMIFFVVSSLAGRNITNIILNLTFTFGFAPPSDFVWGGWSVGVEMIFYAIFPILLLLIKTHKQALVFLIISVIASCALRSALHHQYMTADPSARYDWSYFSFAPNFCYFAMGIYAYLLTKFYKPESKLICLFVPFIASFIIGGLLFSNFGDSLNNSFRFDIVLWGFGLTALCIWQAQHPSYVIASNVFEYLGERSFSIYLLHPIVIYFAKPYLIQVYDLSTPALGNYAYFMSAFILLIAILIIAEFTYRVIEVPGINIGRRLITRRKEV